MSERHEPRDMVAIVTGDFVPTGGMDRANYALATYLSHSGRNVELVAHRVAPQLAAMSHVRVHRVAKPCNSYFLGQHLLAARGRSVGKRVSAAGGRVIVNGGNCLFADVNWVHYVHAAYRPTSSVSAVRRLKRRLEYPLNLHTERRALRAARIVICNSHRTQTDVVETVGIAPEKTHVVYYGNDPGEFYPAEAAARRALRERLGFPLDRPVATFVGALGDRRKGFDTLHAAWESLSRSPGWDALLVVVGSGGELDAWRRRTTAEGLDHHVRYLGFRTDVADILRSADLLVAPTRYEAYGLGVQEALCCGVPAVVSASAGVAERYPPALAELLLADPEDTQALAAVLRRWKADIDDWRSRCVSLGSLLRSRTWDAMSRDFMHVAEDKILQAATAGAS